MGDNRRILAERAIEPALYSDWPLTIELRETFHLHYRNWRPVVDKDQFLQITDTFAEARRKFDELGQPEKDEHGPTLGETKLSPPLHQNRVAIEETTDGTIHFHFDDQRLHLDPRTFVRLGLVFQEALHSYAQHNAKTAKISECAIGDIVTKQYLPWLEEYKEKGTGFSAKDAPSIRVSSDSFPSAYLASRRRLRPEDEQRYSDGWLKHEDGSEHRTRSLDPEFDRLYLFSVYESIKEYGYGRGPYEFDLLRAHKNEHGQLYLTGSHRVASLIALGYEEIKVLETN